jgi:Zn-dependent oligopeptidase
MSEDDLTTAQLAASTPADIAAAADTAIATSRAGFASVKAGDAASDIEIMDQYDEAVAALTDLAALVNMIGKAHPDEDTRAAADAAYQTLSTELTTVTLDPELYAAVSRLDLASGDAATRHYVAKTLREFRRSGVDRDAATRARVRELQDEIVAIGLDFDRNIRSDERRASFAPAVLDGLPDDYVRMHPVGDDGLVTISTEYPDIMPFMAYATDAGAREDMWRLFRVRAHPANTDVLRRLVERRHDLATLLGYGSWAQYVTENKMISSDVAAAEFIAKITDASGKRAAADYAELLECKRIDEPDADAVYPWDAAFLQDRLKSEKLAFDTQLVRPYFEYTRVRAGLMGLVERMFGVTFTLRGDIPVWHPDVEVYDVTWAADGSALGRIFLDMHPRTGKFNHAAMFDMRTGKKSVRLPECALLCNLPKPGAEPALLQHSDVTTYFHEFGHLIHHLIGGHQRWSGISGVATEWDFVEAPSQLLEEWTFDAGTLAEFAVHHETGEPLPAEMVSKLRAADEFGKGLFVRQQMFYASLSLELYRADPATLDIGGLAREAMETHTPYAFVDGTHFELSFGHLDSYSAAYYTYMWSLVIAKDLFTRFADEGLPAPEASAAYRDAVLAAGGSAPAADLVRAFLGRDYTFAAYQAWLED